MNRSWNAGLLNVAWSIGLVLSTGRGVFAQECQNQLEVDACKALCSATSAVCSGACDFVSGACWVGCQAAFGTCDLGCEACDVGCDVCCLVDCPPNGCGSCRDACDDCRSECDRARGGCEGGCRLDCDGCILTCERDCNSICRPFKKIGESCIPLFDRCADGLTCWPFPMPGESELQCFPSDNDDLYDDETCRKFYSPGIHETVINDGTALSFGTGGASAVGIAETLEAGNVYGPDGSYGCYLSTCIGGTSDVEVGLYASVGSFVSYEAFQGEAVMISEEAGEVVVFSFAQFIGLDGSFLGVADCLSLEASLFPIAVGVYDCFTIVDTIGRRDPVTGALVAFDNSPPVAVCGDVVVCADAETCLADASVDAGSLDPDDETALLFQDPPGPYQLGTHSVTLTAEDPDGEADTCTATITVNDCTGPAIAGVTTDPEMLWPPNHKMRRVKIDVGAVDACGAEYDCAVTAVRSSDAQSGLDETDEPFDYEILGPDTVELRAERFGDGDGRRYTITVECIDGGGQTSHGETNVLVPHDMRHHNDEQQDQTKGRRSLR